MLLDTILLILLALENYVYFLPWYKQYLRFKVQSLWHAAQSSTKVLPHHWQKMCDLIYSLQQEISIKQHQMFM